MRRGRTGHGGSVRCNEQGSRTEGDLQGEANSTDGWAASPTPTPAISRSDHASRRDEWGAVSARSAVVLAGPARVDGEPIRVDIGIAEDQPPEGRWPRSRDRSAWSRHGTRRWTSSPWKSSPWKPSPSARVNPGRGCSAASGSSTGTRPAARIDTVSRSAISEQVSGGVSRFPPASGACRQPQYRAAGSQAAAGRQCLQGPCRHVQREFGPGVVPLPLGLDQTPIRRGAHSNAASGVARRRCSPPRAWGRRG